MADDNEEYVDDPRLHDLGDLPVSIHSHRRRKPMPPPSRPAVEGIGTLREILPLEQITGPDGRTHTFMATHLHTQQETRASRDLHLTDPSTGETFLPNSEADAFTLHHLTGDHRFWDVPDVAKRSRGLGRGRGRGRDWEMGGGDEHVNEHALLMSDTPDNCENPVRDLKMMRDHEKMLADLDFQNRLFDEGYEARIARKSRRQMHVDLHDNMKGEDVMGDKEARDYAEVMSSMQRQMEESTGGVASSKLGTSRILPAEYEGTTGAAARNPFPNVSGTMLTDDGDVLSRGQVWYYSLRDERGSARNALSVATAAGGGVSAHATELISRARQPGADRMNNSERLASSGKRIRFVDEGQAGGGNWTQMQQHNVSVPARSDSQRASMLLGNRGGGDGGSSGGKLSEIMGEGESTMSRPARADSQRALGLVSNRAESISRPLSTNAAQDEEGARRQAREDSKRVLKLVSRRDAGVGGGGGGLERGLLGEREADAQRCSRLESERASQLRNRGGGGGGEAADTVSMVANAAATGQRLSRLDSSRQMTQLRNGISESAAAAASRSHLMSAVAETVGTHPGQQRGARADRQQQHLANNRAAIVHPEIGMGVFQQGGGGNSGGGGGTDQMAPRAADANIERTLIVTRVEESSQPGERRGGLTSIQPHEMGGGGISGRAGTIRQLLSRNTNLEPGFVAQLSRELAALPQQMPRRELIQKVATRALDQGMSPEGAALAAAHVISQLSSRHSSQRAAATLRSNRNEGVGGVGGSGPRFTFESLLQLARTLVRKETTHPRDEGGGGRFGTSGALADIADQQASGRGGLSSRRQTDGSLRLARVDGVVSANDFDSSIDRITQVNPGNMRRDMSRYVGAGAAVGRHEFGINGEHVLDTQQMSTDRQAQDSRFNERADSRAASELRLRQTHASRFAGDSIKDAVEQSPWMAESEEFAAYRDDRRVRGGKNQRIMHISSNRRMESDRRFTEDRVRRIQDMESDAYERGVRNAIYDSSGDESSQFED